ncbi:MAG TPA: type II toxin-antitoxin system VapC family toxin [Patescibacteria group bacterium]
MINKYVIDSSVFVSALGQPDTFSEASQQLFFHLEKNPGIILVPTLVTLEVLVNLHKQEYPIQEASDILQCFQSLPLNEELTYAVATFLTKSKTSLKASDFSIALLAHLNEATLITWDKRLLAEGTSICPVSTPTEWLSKV